MSEPEDLRAGVYQHYKGPLYLVLGYGHDANLDQRGPVVVYIGLELNEAHTGPRLAVRDAHDFFAWVHPSNGQVCWATSDISYTAPAPDKCPMNGIHVQRFTYLGPTYEGRRP